MSLAEPVLAMAKEQEKQFDWSGAAQSYKKALSLVSDEDFTKGAEMQERSAYGLYRAAMQSESTDEFTESVGQAISGYETATDSYRRLTQAAKAYRCDAMIASLESWLAPQANEKKRLLEKAWSLTKESLEAFLQAGDTAGYAETYNRLSVGCLFLFVIEWDFQAREKIVREAVEYGEQAIKFCSSFKEPNQLAKAYVRTATFLRTLSYYFLKLEQSQECVDRSQSYWLKARSLNEETALLLSFDHPLGQNPHEWEGVEENLARVKKAIEYARKTRDKLVIGLALAWRAYLLYWKAFGIEDPEEATGLYKEALESVQEGKNEYSKLNYVGPSWGAFWVEDPHPEYYLALSSLAMELGQRRQLLEKALEASPDQLQRAQFSGYPEAVSHVQHVSSRVHTALAGLETDPDRKRGLLEKALSHRYDSIRLGDQLEPFIYWNRGVMQNHLSYIQYLLAGLAKEPENRKGLLQEAIEAKQKALNLCIKNVEFWERKAPLPENRARLSQWQYEHGEMLIRLYELNNDKQSMRKAVEIFREAAESFGLVGHVSRTSECYWKTAQAYDIVGEHLRSAEHFTLTSKYYNAAAEKIPQLKEFYREYSAYMEAWSAIERARQHHARQEYGSAKEYYWKAADLHKSTRRWSFLAPNYEAWAEVENAEDLSRREKSEESTEAFRRAEGLFLETQRSLQRELSKIETPDEKEMVTGLMRAAGVRRQYCEARIATETAKVLDKSGDHLSGSQRYDDATEILQSITQELESEQARREISLIMTLSKAWSMMTRAEAEAAPALYLKASELFEEARGLSLNEKSTLLASGHSRFCKALEAGTRFADTRELALYNNVRQHLENASDYYLKAGFQSAAEYAKATKLLFEAYVYMDKAGEEQDQEKEARLYMMAEKVLKSSASAFAKADYPSKKEHVEKLLEKVREERELALSLTDVLHAPAIMSSTTAFPTPTPGHERAVGLDRFEHADIQVSMIIRRRELKVGEDLDLEIELVNAGKGPAQLIKIEELVPEAFEVSGKPESYRLEDSFLNMKGKQLGPLRTEEVKLVLKPKKQGAFILKPRILYLDESGRYKSHDPEPVRITVRELGISGWLKGR